MAAVRESPKPSSFLGDGYRPSCRSIRCCKCNTCFEGTEADLSQIYGPADTSKEDEDVEADPESSRPLLSDNGDAVDYGGAAETGS
jgi:hypothetical protein